MTARLRVLHAITGLSVGGAEVILARALEEIGDSEFEPRVVSLTTLGDVGPRIRRLGVQVEALEMSSVPSPRGVLAFRRILRTFSPDVVQTWLLHSNVLAGTLARTPPRTPVVWGVHITDVRREVHGAVAVATRRAERMLARRVPASIVACSQSSADVMRDLGYPMDRVTTIPNGFDLERFHPSDNDRREVRDELGITPDALVVGHVARFHPMKDHRNLLRAAGILGKLVPGVEVVLCGKDVSPQNAELARWVEELGRSVRVHLLGPRPDPDRLFRAFDVLALSSVSGEALPLVIGEAMASGVPVVATDCGDAAEVIGDPERVVPVSDPDALARSMASVLTQPADARRELGARARARIAAEFSLSAMADAYAAEWRRAATGG